MPEADKQTMAFYTDAAERYADKFGNVNNGPWIRAYLKRLPEGARVLDIGCGPGNSSAALVAAGHTPDPVDASPDMVRIARETHGLPARIGTFDDDFGVESYDGIWASYSLLHARRDAIPGYIRALAAALRPGGPFYIGLKLGEGERRDHLGRLYAYVTEAELEEWLGAAGLVIEERKRSVKRGCAGTDDPCIDLIAVKPPRG